MTIKHSFAILIVCGNEILLKVLTHEEYDILDFFGSFIKENESPENKARNILDELGLPNDTLLMSHGHIFDIVHKPKEDVELHVVLYKVKLNKSKLKKSTLYSWFDKSIATDPRTQRICKVIELAFKEDPKSIYWEENQFGRWIDSETIRWEENVLPGVKQ